MLVAVESIADLVIKLCGSSDLSVLGVPLLPQLPHCFIPRVGDQTDHQVRVNAEQ